MNSLKLKIASEEWEYEAIHKLNYKTFVEEIPQHVPNSEKRLVDKYHEENTYAICLHGRRLVGMVCGRSQRPFSLDKKLENLEEYLPDGHKLVEVRLLSVEKEYRTGPVFCELVRLLGKEFRLEGCDLAIISGTTRQLKLYQHLGFQPFGPVIGTDGAQYQPMFLTLEEFFKWSKAIAPDEEPTHSIIANLLPGPVQIDSAVQSAFAEDPCSHRTNLFIADFQSTRRMLCELTKAKSVQILLGSGTLANDAVAAQLRIIGDPGIILSNGEFGDRLVEHATRMGLKFVTFRKNWGQVFEREELCSIAQENPDNKWLWATHCETSTGVLNNLNMLQSVTERNGIKLCMDCISTIGTIPLDLSFVYLATCVSGKALSSYPGLSMVFYNHGIKRSSLVPRYLDLGYYEDCDGVPFTHSSNLVRALQTALRRTDWNDRYIHCREYAEFLRSKLEEKGFHMVAPREVASHGVMSMVLPRDCSSSAVGKALIQEGYLLSYRSSYLLKHNCIQICLMSDLSKRQLVALPDLLYRLCSP